MRMLEGKKLADIKPEERRQVEDWMKKEPKQLINDLIVPALVRDIEEIKALKMRGGLLEKMVILLGAIVVGFAACVVFL